MALTNYFIDYDNGDDSLNDGLTFDTPWKTVNNLNLNTGGMMWVRRNANYATASSESFNGTAVGCPRNEESGTATFTKDSFTVSAVDFTVDEYKHLSRNITTPDGEYFITKFIDTASFEINKPFTGDTGTGIAFTIVKDEHYDEFQLLTDGTIGGQQKADWNADAYGAAKIDFSLGAGYTYNLKMYNFVFEKGYGGGTAWFSVQANTAIRFKNCLFVSNPGSIVTNSAELLSFDNCVFKMISTTPAYIMNGAYLNVLRNIAVHGNGTAKAFITVGNGHNVTCENLTVSDAAITPFKMTSNNSIIKVKDFYYAGTTPCTFREFTLVFGGALQIENDQLEHGVHITYTKEGVFSNNTGDGVSLRSGGSEEVLDILMNTAHGGVVNYSGSSLGYAPLVFGTDNTARIYVDDVASAKNYRFYVQSVVDELNSINAADPSGRDWDLWLETEYIDTYNSVNGSTTNTIIKDNRTLSARTGDGDWSQYLETGSIQPAVAGWVTFRIFCNKVDVSNKRFIDPQMQVL